MPGFLRQASASQSRALGPFISSSDFLTPQTGLTIANTDIKLVVNGAASANKNSGGGTHRVNGVYGVTFDATDTATVGEMEVSVVVSGALPVFDKWTVIEEAAYDAQYAASAPGYVVDQPVNTTKFGGTTVTGRDLGASVLLSSGTGTGQIKIASGYVAPDWGDVANKTTTNALTGTTIATSQVVASVSGAVGSVTGAVGSVTGLTASDVGAIKAKTDNLPAAPASTTNITAGTITTVTNLTNAPTAGDFTATMKTSLNAATPASVVGAVGSVTGSVGSVAGNITGNLLGTLTTTERNAICDAALVRDWTAVGTAAARSTMNALRFLRNKWSISGGVLTTTKEDDSTTAWTGAVTQTAGNPVSSIDPS